MITPCSTPATASRLIAVVCLALALLAPAVAYETDQFTDRLTPLEDATEVLNQRVNQAIGEVVESWRWGPDRVKFCYEVYQRVGGRHWVDRLERWAMTHDSVDRIEIGRGDSIYDGHPIWATRVAFIFGVGATIKVNDVRIGTDKIGHFFSQGLKFYRRFLRMGDEAQAAEHSAYTERALFGQLTTGSYSNADLVANYEGYRFYRSLFESGVTGSASIVEWTGSGWRIQRPFDWADHVNDYWDEALNINHYDELLKPHMARRLQTFCDDYRRDPESYRVHDEASLRSRYRALQLRPTQDLRLDALCRARITRSNTGPADAGPACTGSAGESARICKN